MGGLIRPVGPEPAETYWKRRALVLGATLVLVIIVLLFWISAGNSPGQAAPAGSGPATAAPPTPSPRTGTTTPSPTPSALPSPTPSTLPSPTPSTLPSTSPSASARLTTSARPSAFSRRSGSAHPSAAATQSAGSGRSATAVATRGSTQPAACRAKDLRVTLRGDRRRVPVKSAVHFRLSVINGSSTSCRLTINADDFELQITSGVDRIWSSDDCARLVPDLTRTVRPEQDLGWTMTWDGRRSRQGAGCTTRPEIPGPGYYHATARLAGARPVSFLLVLT